MPTVSLTYGDMSCSCECAWLGKPNRLFSGSSYQTTVAMAALPGRAFMVIVLENLKAHCLFIQRQHTLDRVANIIDLLY